MRDKHGMSEEARLDSHFESFYSAQFEGVLTMLLGLVRHRWLAEELAQEAFIKAHRDWKSVSKHPNPVGWVRRVAINLSRSRWRTTSAEARALVRLAGQGSVPEHNIERLDVWDAIRSLPRRQREVVVLCYFNDLSVGAIADAIGIAEGTVKATLHQARQRLAEELGGEL